MSIGKVKNKIIISFFISILVGVLLFFYSEVSPNKTPSNKKLIKSNSQCEPQKQKCRIKGEDFNLDFMLDENIYYLKPFNVSAWLNSSIEVMSITTNFKMTNMNMGINRFKLMKEKPEHVLQKYSGKALLPICVTGRADWIVEMIIELEKVKYLYTFPILVKKK
ncbi:MAG: hypothetical protein QM484_10485 [Woeseiaceae bacterium]